MLPELLDPVLEFDDFDGAAEAGSSSEGFELGEQVVVGGVLAAQPNVVECFLEGWNFFSTRIYTRRRSFVFSLSTSEFLLVSVLYIPCWCCASRDRAQLVRG